MNKDDRSLYFEPVASEAELRETLSNDSEIESVTVSSSSAVVVFSEVEQAVAMSERYAWGTKTDVKKKYVTPSELKTELENVKNKTMRCLPLEEYQKRMKEFEELIKQYESRQQNVNNNNNNQYEIRTLINVSEIPLQSVIKTTLTTDQDGLITNNLFFPSKTSRKAAARLLKDREIEFTVIDDLPERHIDPTRGYPKKDKKSIKKQKRPREIKQQEDDDIDNQLAMQMMGLL